MQQPQRTVACRCDRPLRKADVAAGLKTGKTWAVFQGHYDHGRFAAAIACLK